MHRGENSGASLTLGPVGVPLSLLQVKWPISGDCPPWEGGPRVHPRGLRGALECIVMTRVGPCDPNPHPGNASGCGSLERAVTCLTLQASRLAGRCRRRFVGSLACEPPQQDALVKLHLPELTQRVTGGG